MYHKFHNNSKSLSYEIFSKTKKPTHDIDEDNKDSILEKLFNTIRLQRQKPLYKDV